MTERDREGAREGQGDRCLKLYPVARDKGEEAGKGNLFPPKGRPWALLPRCVESYSCREATAHVLKLTVFLHKEQVIR